MTVHADMDVKNNIIETIGDTPLVRFQRVGKDLPCDLIAKVEFFNPGGSVKDRIGIQMIRAAEAEGKLKPGGTIVECTSGNTGMGLALAAAVLGYKAVFTMPDKMSAEKINLLKAVGAEVHVAPTAVPADAPESYYKVAERIVEETPGAFHMNQYHNQANPETHYRTTGPELWSQTAGRITHFVAGMGTGGTISGTGRYLEQNPGIRIIGVDPIGSILHQYYYTKEMGEAHPYKVEGVGEDIIPTTTHFQVIDEVVQVNDKDSLLTARRVAHEEGILIGGSCGLAVAGALKALGATKEGDVAVVLLPDTGERYLSKLYNDEWMRDNGFLEPETIEDLMAFKPAGLPGLVSLEPDHTVREAIDLVRKHDVSFIPVIEGSRSVGTLNENKVMRAVFEDPSILDRKASEVMSEPLVSVSLHEPVKAAMKALASTDPAVLVVDSGKPVGILTRTDVFEYISQ